MERNAGLRKFVAARGARLSPVLFLLAGRRSHLRPDLPLALVASATAWLTMMSWRSFSTDWGAFLWPLLAITLTSSLCGVVLRTATLSRNAGLALHFMAIAAVVWLILGGSVIHPFASTSEIDLAIQNAWVSASTNTAPVPATAPSLAPLVIVCGAAALLFIDVFACWLGRVPLAGLTLVAVYAAPTIGYDGDVSWQVFVVAALGFLLMMFLQQSFLVSRWGRPLDATEAPRPTRLGRAGAGRAKAGTVGGVAVMLAVILPVFIPTLHLSAPDMFRPGGGGDVVKLTNPIVTMRRDLHRAGNPTLLDVTTDNPDPSYLRIAVLTRFDGVEWSPGDRPPVSGQVADGLMPVLEQGLSDRVSTTDYRYTVRATEDFDSTWLPTQFPVSYVVAPGTWHYDTTTMDFFSQTSSTRGITYRMTAAVPAYSARSLSVALSAPPQIQATYTHLPDDAAAMSTVHQFALQATDGATNPYQMAVRLQDWFRTTGGFHYSLKAQPENGSDALVRFLTRGNGGRVGYCQQFASAYAVMARTLGIPARVAVGFLHPIRGDHGDWLYKAYDLHAWPELYFEGSGWVRFEPTPAGRAGTAPAWTSGLAEHQTGKHHRTVSGGHRTELTTPATPTGHPETTTTTSTTGSGFPWAALTGALGCIVVVAALIPLPGLIRRSRRARRVAGGAEDAWSELRDTAIDLGVSWPAGRSPRETGTRLSASFGAEPEGPPLLRPARGHGLAPDAERALDRIVLRLEHVRYSRFADDEPGALADDVRTCITALERGCARDVLFRARWLPGSVFGRSAPVAPGAAPEPQGVGPSGASDRVR